MKTMKWTLLLAFFAIWACQEEQLSPEEVWKDSSFPSPRVERLRTIKRVDNAPATRAVGVKDKLWQPGDTIRIKFQNADEYPDMPDKVIQYAAIWLKYANLHFEYVDKENDADVKIGFDMDDRGLSWSTIGTDCKQISQDEVSLNFVGLEFSSNEVIQGEVLRNFGHVLGLGFEHRSPASPITLNEAQTLKFFKRDLSKEDIINDILPYYNTDQTNYTEFDPLSIMVLELPSALRADTNSKIDLKYNYTLSSKDISFVRDSLYPTPPRMDCLMEITVNSNYIDFKAELKDSIIIEFDNEHKETFYPSRGVVSYCYMFNQNREEHNTKIFGSDSAMINFIIDSHQATSIILNENNALKELGLGANRLNSLNLSKCSVLEDLYCENNNITNLDVSQNINLKNICISNNELKSIDISKNINLQYLDCHHNLLTQIDISKNKALWHLGCGYNNITSLDLSGNPNLLDLFAYHNNLDTIDISRNPNLINLTVPYNKIKHIKFYKNSDLTFLHCEYNEIAILNNLSSLINMTIFHCQKNLFSKAALLAIANDVRDRSSLGSNGGSVLYDPLDDTITQIFNQKNWSITTEMPYLIKFPNNSSQLMKLYSLRNSHFQPVSIYNNIYQ